MVSFGFLINALVAEKIDFENCLFKKTKKKIQTQISQQPEHLSKIEEIPLFGIHLKIIYAKLQIHWVRTVGAN